MKFVVVASTRLAEPKQLLEGQRREYLQSLRDLTRSSMNEKGRRRRFLSRGRSCI